MAKQAFREPRNFQPRTKELLDKVLAVVEEYRQQGYRLTLRQLYYQLVVQNVFENLQKNYSKLGELLGEARMTGLCDWGVIEDRIRVPRFPNEFADIADAMDTIITFYRRERWSDQDNYVEVWCEKDALSGVLEPITRDFHVHLLVNRGYSSISAMYEAAQRFLAKVQEGKTCHLLYFGDFDPSGEDMVRDIKTRLTEFGCTIEVEKIGLTREQVEQHNLPPNPAKTTDPRSRGFISEHGDESWELDALPPRTLNTLLRRALRQLCDEELYNAQISKEKEDKDKMRSFGQENDEDDE